MLNKICILADKHDWHTSVLRTSLKNKNLERLLFGSLMAFGFNLILKILGNIAIINNISPGLTILIPSLIVGLMGLKLLRI